MENTTAITKNAAELEILTKPMTIGEYFEKICEVLKDKGRLPDILDYHLPDNNAVLLKTSDFSITNNLDYGGSEGIYLDLGIRIHGDDGPQLYNLGTFKTLDDSDEAMRTMAVLLADFIVESYDYVGSHSDNFRWSGYTLQTIRKNGERCRGRCVFDDKDAALDYMKTHFMDVENENVVGVALFDSVERTETIYEKEQKQA